MTLIASKNRGGLVKPSTSVFKIVSGTESCIKSLINFPSKLNKNLMSLSVNQSLVNPLPQLNEHRLKKASHLLKLSIRQLTKELSKCTVVVGCSHMEKNSTRNVTYR